MRIEDLEVKGSYISYKVFFKNTLRNKWILYVVHSHKCCDSQSIQKWVYFPVLEKGRSYFIWENFNWEMKYECYANPKNLYFFKAYENKWALWDLYPIEYIKHRFESQKTQLYEVGPK